ncbi:MAG: ATP-binding cassette domain-containing protein [Gemmatimonadales bacterium]|nr:ATP-binding cassette domain-containing protein [Gemmatimonadales bacterium]
MALLGLQEITLSFGGPPLLDRATLAIERGERVCLIGRNGAGKSTIMKLLDGSLRPDSGEVVRQTGVTVARLEQEVPGDVAGTLFDIVAEGLGASGRLLADYQHASHRVALDHSDAALNELDRLHHALDAANAWEVKSQVETVLEHLGLDPEAPFAAASGGRKRQTLLARALVAQPDVLLLDEPTNHLDVAAIEWMESYLIARGTTMVFVTHDRAFLRRMATRIVDLDRGKLVDWATDYDTYLERKAASLETQAAEWSEFDKKLAREEVWIRTGIQARRTRNEGRVRALEALRLERSARRERTGTVRLQAQEGERSGKLVVEAKGVSFGYGDEPIVSDLTTTIARGDRIGLVGPNGVGKTTLLRLLLGQLTPDSGTIRLGTNLEVAYFDQLREQLDPEQTVVNSIGDGTEYIEINGARKHVLGYLQDFLFSPERARTPVRVLSGGERNRLLLARLFTRRFNVLVLDEPTNDLDIETLDLLEELLANLSATLLIVSHDRAFLDNVVTSTLVFEGEGRVGEYVGGYSDWVRQRDAAGRAARAASPPRATGGKPTVQKGSGRRKLPHKDAVELAALPDQIDAAERQREELLAVMADQAARADAKSLAATAAALAALEQEIARRIARWEELELKAGEG